MKQVLISLALAAVTSVASAQDLPPKVAELVRQIGLKDLEWHPGDHQPDLEGRLSGTWVEINFRRGGSLEEIQAAHDGLFPAQEIEAAVPEALKKSPDYPADAAFSKIEFDRDQIKIEGRTMHGQWFEAKFDGSGHLEEWDKK